MDTTPDWLDVASLNQQATYEIVMRAVASLQPDPQGSGGGAIELFSTIDGLVAVIASMAGQSGVFDTVKKRRQFADRVREALLKNLKEADASPEGQWTMERLGGLH